MDAIQPPRGTYDRPPDGNLPAECPQCGCTLAQFHQVAPPVATAAPPTMPSLPELLGDLALQPYVQQPVLESFPAVNNPPTRDYSITLVGMLHGQDYGRHTRFLRHLRGTAGLAQTDLRFICNNVSRATLVAAGALEPAHVYTPAPPLTKFQAMRMAFRDHEHPLATSWVVWLDDGVLLKRTDWLTDLLQVITDQGIERVGAIGNKFAHALPVTQRRDPREWFKQSTWWHNLDLRSANGNESPNGHFIHYVSPNFFALSRAAIRDCDIPDPRLRNSGGGIVIGEQLHQNGFKLKVSIANLATRIEAQSASQETYPWLAT